MKFVAPRGADEGRSTQKAQLLRLLLLLQPAVAEAAGATRQRGVERRVRLASRSQPRGMPTYTFNETEADLELHIPLPTGTRRNQLSITLHDEASGANLWRAEIETAGGEERHAPRARLRVVPSFWPEPLLDGVLRGAVDARESSYQLTASGGGDAWDSLVVTFRKAPDAEGLWHGVVEGDDAHFAGEDGHDSD